MKKCKAIDILLQDETQQALFSWHADDKDIKASRVDPGQVKVPSQAPPVTHCGSVFMCALDRGWRPYGLVGRMPTRCPARKSSAEEWLGVIMI